MNKNYQILAILKLNNYLYYLKAKKFDIKI